MDILLVIPALIPDLCKKKKKIHCKHTDLMTIKVHWNFVNLKNRY